MNVLAAVRTAGRVVGEVLRLVFVEPVRDGRLRAGGWPPGLAAIVALAGAAFVAAAVLVLAGPAVRRRSDLLVGLGVDLVYPRWTTALFLTLVVLTLALLHAASLHLSPWLRVGALLVVGLGLLSSAVDTWDDNPRANLTVLVGAGLLVLLTAVRWRASFAWWEFVVSLVVVGGSVGLSSWFVADRTRALGFDTTPTTLATLMQWVSNLAIPFTVAAGLAFAQLALLLAQRVGGVVDEHVGPTPLVAVVVAALAALAVVLVVLRLLRPSASGTGHVAEWVSSGLLLAGAVAIGFLVVRGAGPADRGLDLLEGAVSRLALPIGFVVYGSGFLALLLSRVQLVSIRFSGGEELPLRDLVDFFFDSTTFGWTRLVAGVLLVTGALWQRSRLPVVAVLAATIGSVLAFSQLGDTTGQLVTPAWTSEAVTDLAAVAALVALVALAATRTLDRRRLVLLGTALGFSLAYSVRSTFDAPFVTLFGLGAAAAVFLGVVWATLTDGDDANADSLRYPRPARVLFFLANALLAMTTLAFLSVADTGQLGIDLSPLGALGDEYLGTGLLLAAYALVVRELVSPRPAPPRRSPAS